MAKEATKTKNEVDYPSLSSSNNNTQPLPIHHHNGVDSPFIDKQNKRHLGIYLDYLTAVNATNVTVANATWTVATLTTEVLDPSDMHSTTINPSRLTVPYGGVYRITGYVLFATNATGDRGARLYKNGISTGISFYSRPDATGNCSIQFDFAASLVSSDYIQLYIYQSSTASMDVAYVQLGLSFIGN